MRYLFIILLCVVSKAATPLTGPWTTTIQYNRTNMDAGPNGLNMVFNTLYATNLNVTATGTSVARSVQDEFADVLNIKRFGVSVGDGVTDTTAALTAALNAATSGKSGKIYFPKGNYRFNSSIVLPATITNSITIYGDKELESRLLFYGSGDFITTGGTGASEGGYAFENLMIQNSSTNTAATNGVVLENGQQYLRLINVIISQFTQGIGLKVNKTYSGYLTKVYITECLEAARFGETGGSDFINAFDIRMLHVENCTSTNYVVRILRPSGFSWDGGVLQRNASGVLVQDGFSVELSHLYTEENGTNALVTGNAEFHLESNQSAVIKNCFINGHDPAGSDYAGIKVGRTIIGSAGPTIEDNVIQDYRYAISFVSAFGNVKSLYLKNNTYNNNSNKFRFVNNLESGEHIYEEVDGKLKVYNNIGTFVFGINDTNGRLRFEGNPQGDLYLISSASTITNMSSTKPYLYEHQFNPADNTANIFYGQWNRPEIAGSKTVGGLIGWYLGLRNLNTTTVPYVGAADVEVTQVGGGVITDAVGIRLKTPVISSGSIGNYKAINIEPITSPTGTIYGIYDASTNAYFGGTVTVNTGITLPGGDVQTQLDTKQAAFSTGIGVTNLSNTLHAMLGAGANITLTTNGNRIDIAAAAGSGEANTISSLGAGQSLVSGKSGVDLQIYSISGSGGISVGSPSSSVVPISYVGTNSTTIAISDPISTITAGTGKQYWDVPFVMTIKAVRITLQTQSSSGVVTVNIKKNGTTIFSTKPTIDATETSSSTAATPNVLSTTTAAVDDRLTFDIDDAGTGAKNLQVTIYWVKG